MLSHTTDPVLSSLSLVKDKSFLVYCYSFQLGAETYCDDTLYTFTKFYKDDNLQFNFSAKGKGKTNFSAITFI